MEARTLILEISFCDCLNFYEGGPEPTESFPRVTIVYGV